MARKCKILIIDDNELILEGLKLYLAPKFDVVTVSDPSAVFMDLGKIRFDLILTDLSMPAVNGFGLLSALRQHHPGTPIIAMSGWGNPPQDHKLKADALLLKPFDLDELDRSLSELLVHRV